MAERRTGQANTGKLKAGRPAEKRAGNKASLVYDQLRADILNGVLAPGTPLSQLAIASASGYSRGPVREALRRLQQDQLVIARTNQRFNVAPFDIADLEAVLCLHLANVSLAIRVSVPFLTEPEVAHLRQCVRKMDRLAMAAGLEWEAAYRDFTLTLIKHSAPRTESLVELLIDNIQRHRHKTLEKMPSVYSGGPEFGAILEAAANHDEQLASSRYAAFISRMSMLILAGVAPRYNASRLREYVAAMGHSEFGRSSVRLDSGSFCQKLTRREN